MGGSIPELGAINPPVDTDMIFYHFYNSNKLGNDSKTSDFRILKQTAHLISVCISKAHRNPASLLLFRISIYSKINNLE